MQNLKSQIREAAKKRRARAFAACHGAGEKLVQIFPKQIEKTGIIVAAYVPIGSEIDPFPLMRELQNQGASLCLPRVNNITNSLDFRQYQFEDELETSGFGVPEPLASQKIVSPNWLLVPLLAFDKNCNRLGYGKGYYDKAIANLRANGTLTIGLAFAAQEFEAIPIEAHDEPLDFIVTETNCYQNPKSKNSLELK